VFVDVIRSHWSQIGPGRWRVAAVWEASVVGVADPVVPMLADVELRAAAPVPLSAALLPTLAQPATMRATAAAHHGRPIRRTIATTVFRIGSGNFLHQFRQPVRLPIGPIGCAFADGRRRF
jgi:hypothetical protein